jgi:hypothetical protein
MKKMLIPVIIFALAGATVVLVVLLNAVPASIKPKTFGGSKYDSIRAMCASKQGYMLAGMTMSSGIGYVDAYMLCLNNKGEKLWENTFGGKGDDRLYDIINTGNGYVLAGYTSSYGAGNNDFYLICTNEKGDLKYTKTFGGKGKDEAYSLAVTDDGGYILAGMSDSFNKAGVTQVYVVKTDADGNSVWSMTYGNGRYDTASSVIKAADNGYVICGTTTSPGHGMQDMLLLKTDSRGNTIWAKAFGGANPDFGSRVISTPDGGYALIGTTGSFGAGNSDIYMVKTDAQGNSVWSKTYGGAGTDQGVTLINSGDNGYIIGGTSDSFSYGSSDLLVIAVDASGNTLWTRHFGGKQDDYLGAIIKDKDGGYAIAGWTASSGAGDYDAYFLKIRKNGDY